MHAPEEFGYSQRIVFVGISTRLKFHPLRQGLQKKVQEIMFV
jgi:hypothetical protein